ncbi:MAG: inositol-3-phosphate synthase [Candidatus Bathyarchaeota archaeon]|nr:inositol-3-phosphate synthase [Candidatus Bathyarchaeota archaeon]
MLPRIKVGLIGVGNCASALVQGVYYCRSRGDSVKLKYPEIGGFRPEDIEFVCAFDISEGKVGRDLSEAIFAPPNNAPKISDVPNLGVEVLKGPVLDGLNEYTKRIIKVNPALEVDVAEKIRESGAEIMVNLLPGGAREASLWYANEVLEAGCAFINATPTLIASDFSWDHRFREACLPLIGDDLMDQVGATFLHKAILEALNRRGVQILKTYQLDVGGGTESSDIERAWGTKRAIKTKTIEMVLPYKASVVAGSTDFVDFLGNRRDSYIWISGECFGGVGFEIEIRLNTIDAPNAALMLLDVIRGAKLALLKGEGGHILPISAYAFKHPAKILPIYEAEKLFEEYISSKS